MEIKELFLANVKKYIRPQTDPVAVKLVFDDTPAPEGAIMPLEKYGYPLTLCQGVSAARRMGLTMVFRMEDNACPPQLCAFGYLPQENLLAGKVTVPGYAGNEEAAKKIEAANVLLKEAPKAIWIAPYETATFEPDVVIVYGNSAQATRLAQGYAYYTGDGVKSYTLGRLACAGYINKVFVNQEPTIVIPGGGERVLHLEVGGGVDARQHEIRPCCQQRLQAGRLDSAQVGHVLPRLHGVVDVVDDVHSGDGVPLGDRGPHGLLGVQVQGLAAESASSYVQSYAVSHSLTSFVSCRVIVSSGSIRRC